MNITASASLNLPTLKKHNPKTHDFVVSALINRNLSSGDHTLLAKAIADTITLCPSCLTDFSNWFLQQKGFVQEVVCFVYDQCLGLNEDKIIRLTKQFVEWRARIAFNPPSLVFTQGQDYMVDELTAIGLFVDQGTLCSFADRYQTAPVMYNGFRQVAAFIKTGESKNNE